MKNSLFITELYDSSKTNYVRYGEAFMANLNRKERRAQRNESNTIGILLRLFFGLSFIGFSSIWRVRSQLCIFYLYSRHHRVLNLRDTQQIPHHYILSC